MSISKALFLTRFYATNAIKAKVGGLVTGPFIRRNQSPWNALRERYGGHDEWLVVGNGPSLTAADLSALAFLPSVASNRINLIYEQTDWRPTLYTVADPLLLMKLPESHYQDFDLTLLPHSVFYLAKTSQKLAWRHMTYAEGRRQFDAGRGLPDPISGFVSARTITVPNIQLAMWCGARTVYLLGCDHFYQEASHAQVIKLEHGSTPNHFHPEYRKPGEIVNNAPIEAMNRGFDLVRGIAERNEVRIVNISRRSALDTFERGSVEEVAGGSEKARLACGEEDL